MTIKEQLYDAIDEADIELYKNSAIYKVDVAFAATNCESVVSDIAIKFGLFLKNTMIDKDYYAVSELFELFKKENNL